MSDLSELEQAAKLYAKHFFERPQISESDTQPPEDGE